MQQLPADFLCRPMLLADLPTLAEFLPRVLDGNWAENHLASQMSSHHEFLVLTKLESTSETIVGFAEFYCVLDEFHLLNFAIFEHWQRQGLARIFLKELLRVLRARDCVQCLLEVRRSNLRAVQLYEQAGFKLVGVRPNYYSPQHEEGLREDALLYSWSVSESESA
ncbi:MAG: ribosomal protein S18-alanine N-acetyltransferase [Pseudomonadota bacterium]